MPPTLFLRLAADPAFRAAVCRDPAQTLAPLNLSPLQQCLLHLVACRLQAGLVPPICSYWWNGDAVLDGWQPSLSGTLRGTDQGCRA